VVVSESVRGTGVGRALVEAAETVARGWTCDGVEVASRRSREQAYAVYRHLGYEDTCEQATRFWKPLHHGA
jgi:GNAT superfamily N-acetyltransferase